jgi:hypothetical protein
MTKSILMLLGVVSLNTAMSISMTTIIRRHSVVVDKTYSLLIEMKQITIQFKDSLEPHSLMLIKTILDTLKIQTQPGLQLKNAVASHAQLHHK